MNDLSEHEKEVLAEIEEKLTVRDWRELKPGMHYRLSCGCEGYVLSVTLDGPGVDPSDYGFYMAYTKEHGRETPSLCEAYVCGHGPYCNMFNYDPEEFMPAKFTIEPRWWDVVAKLRGWPRDPEGRKAFWKEEP